GGLDSAGETVSTSGIGFREVVVPFTYRDGVLSLDDAVASSPAVALKVNGTVNERTNLVDLAGVLSPAYGLTGALNEVPLLGQILGGEGEGVLAMTFRMRGPVEDPRFTVNPLSLLAPGFLRKIFTAPTGEVSDEFRENLSQGR
ncbi:MAG TPA: AsmA-like C-terminal domain-containing protein, partial [Paracoccaceae bacterium]|nr:AsmA-like C-terminal domain-containing protein [Paracoccaceae bacterium]